MKRILNILKYGLECLCYQILGVLVLMLMVALFYGFLLGISYLTYLILTLL